MYTIGFKNNTTSNILDVVIDDSLSSMLQANTVKVISASHKCKTTVRGNRVLFQLMDIKLPTATTSATKSLGFVSFSVKPKTTLVANTVIVNKAYTSYNNAIPIVTTASTLVKPFVTPLRFISYELSVVLDKNIANIWTTANEINVSHYNIQRSVNGKDFVNIGKEIAKNKAKNEYRNCNI